MKRVLFFIESLSGGGAEKVLITLLSHFDYRKYSVRLLTVSDAGVHRMELEEIIKRNPDGIEYKSICGKGKSLGQKLLYKLIYNVLPPWLVCRLFILSGCDVYVAFVEGFCTKVLSNKRGLKVSWVHIDLAKNHWTLNKGIYKNLNEEREVYGKYAKVVCVSRSVENVMKNYYGMNNVSTIYNPIDIEEIQKRAEKEIASMSSSFNIISVGRLVKQKGYDLLIPIIGHLKGQGLDVRLYILGEGEERGHLETLIADYHLGDTVYLLGYKSNPYPYMKHADLFVCSSRAEGYSLVVAEALTLGTPVVSMRCSGPEEVLGKGKYGLLCDDYEQLEKEIAQLVMDRNRYEDVKHLAEGGKNRFDIEHTMSQVYTILSDVDK